MKRDEHPATTRSKVETAKGSGAAVQVQVAENIVREDLPNVFIARYVLCAVNSFLRWTGGTPGEPVVSSGSLARAFVQRLLRRFNISNSEGLLANLAKFNRRAHSVRSHKVE